jgi:hypothetical protein
MEQLNDMAKSVDRFGFQGLCQSDGQAVKVMNDLLKLINGS